MSDETTTGLRIAFDRLCHEVGAYAARAYAAEARVDEAERAAERANARADETAEALAHEVINTRRARDGESAANARLKIMAAELNVNRNRAIEAEGEMMLTKRDLEALRIKYESKETP